MSDRAESGRDAVAAPAEFPIGSGHMVPTQLFLIPLFAVAPVALVPARVYAGLVIGLLGEVLLGRSRADRVVYCGGDAMHALGPAFVLTVLAGGDPPAAPAAVLVLAFVAQLTLDFVSSSLHDRLVFGTRLELHVRVVLQVWAVDAVLTPLGLLAALAINHHSPLLGLALDDFGTGYSSLSHLARTIVDLLKLDRAFPAGIDGDASQARLLEGVLQLASSLGVSVLAEGFERPGQRERVLELGGRLGQGFLLGAPVTEEEIAARLAPGRTRRRAAVPSVT